MFKVWLTSREDIYRYRWKSSTEDTQALRQKSDDLQSTADALVLPLRPHQLSPSARQAELFSLVREHVRARPDGGPTAWDALLGDGADSEGLALTFHAGH